VVSQCADPFHASSGCGSNYASWPTIRIGKFNKTHDNYAGAAATFVVYDWFLVFGDGALRCHSGELIVPTHIPLWFAEFETIYRSRWSMPKTLFYYVRIVSQQGIRITALANVLQIRTVTPPGIIIGSFGMSPSCQDLFYT
jgi:hypothetical protein